MQHSCSRVVLHWISKWIICLLSVELLHETPATYLVNQFVIVVIGALNYPIKTWPSANTPKIGTARRRHLMLLSNIGDKNRGLRSFSEKWFHPRLVLTVSPNCFNQLGLSKTKTTWLALHPFSRASRQLNYFASSSDWFIRLFVFVTDQIYHKCEQVNSVKVKTLNVTGVNVTSLSHIVICVKCWTVTRSC